MRIMWTGLVEVYMSIVIIYNLFKSTNLTPVTQEYSAKSCPFIMNVKARYTKSHFWDDLMAGVGCMCLQSQPVQYGAMQNCSRPNCG